MARFLFTVWPFAGHVHPCIAIAQALSARGHEVAFYSGGSVQSLIEQRGFRYFPFTSVNEEQVSQLVASEFSFRDSLLQKLRRAKTLQANFRAWLLDTIPQQLQDLTSVLNQWRPDVLACDSALWGPILVLAETQPIPVAVLSVLAACILPGPDAPAWGQGSPRPKNSWMRLRATMQRKLITKLSAGFRADVNALRERYGLSPLNCSVTEFAGRMPLYLVPSAREYDYNRQDLPSSVHHVGPCLWDKPDRQKCPEWLQHLDRDRPLVYVTEATIGTSEPFLLNQAARALQDLPVQVVMTTGKQRDPAQLKKQFPAPNLRFEAYVPQSDLLPRTSVMVTLGGSGGVLAALTLGCAARRGPHRMGPSGERATSGGSRRRVANPPPTMHARADSRCCGAGVERNGVSRERPNGLQRLSPRTMVRFALRNCWNNCTRRHWAKYLNLCLRPIGAT